MPDTIPLGKLPAELLTRLLSRTPIRDPRVIVGPRAGEDAAVIDIGSHYLIAKTDPITFATDEIGWYAVNINANDIAATGGTPAWFMATILLPGGLTPLTQVEAIFDQLQRACDSLNVTLVGGHTEVTNSINRPIVNGVMLGLVEKERLILTGGAQPGDAILVTKGVPVEATAIIARECAARLKAHFAEDFIEHCANYLHDPGISIVRDAQIAQQAGVVHAMHDPTEGGLSTGLWEMAEASGTRLIVDPASAILDDGWRLCDLMGLDPLGAIASGALLMSVAAADASVITAALQAANIATHQIGYVEAGPAAVLIPNNHLLHRPVRDEIARLFE
jgi:hydrogenase expression/formation protein HypE